MNHPQTIDGQGLRLQPEAIPHRKIIRSWLEDSTQRSTARAVTLVAFDLMLFLLLLGSTILVPQLWLKLLLGLAQGFVIARLFIIGHDACHQSLSSHARLNQWLGRLVFLPSLTPYSLWDVGHNVVHHGYTNLKDFDFIWQPKTREEFDRLTPSSQRLERIYRSGWAPWLYYLVEVWWQRLYFPSRRRMPTRRKVFGQDGLLVSAAALVWIGVLVAAALNTRQSVVLLVLTGFVLPFLVWNALIGFVVYVHHTHIDIRWHADKAAWTQAQPFVSTTVHMTFGKVLGLDLDVLLHHIMQHTAHHVDMRIPLYRLKQAQRILEERMPGNIVIQRFSWRWYFDTARHCKLYDFKRDCWTDFSGVPTSGLEA